MLDFVRKRVIFFPSVVTISTLLYCNYFKSHYVCYGGFHLCIMIEVHDDAVNHFEMHFLLVLHD